MAGVKLASAPIVFACAAGLAFAAAPPSGDSRDAKLTPVRIAQREAIRQPTALDDRAKLAGEFKDRASRAPGLRAAR